MQKHELKVWPVFFDAVCDGRKTFEMRKDDKGYQPGDVLILQEWDTHDRDYTGREIAADVGYMLHTKGGFAVLSLTNIRGVHQVEGHGGNV